MINNLPDEVILEIFASYRQGIDPYDYQWSKKCVWFQSHAYLPKVARCHLCVVLPFKFGHFRGTGKTGRYQEDPVRPFAFFADSHPLLYGSTRGNIESWNSSTDNTLCRLRAALRQHDRVREIFFGGTCADFMELFKATNSSFSVLESLSLCFTYKTNLEFPATILRGKNQSDLHLRRLRLYHVSAVASISGIFVLRNVSHRLLFANRYCSHSRPIG